METWSNSTWTDAGQILAFINPDKEEPPEATGSPLPSWYAQLVEQGDLSGALDFIAHAMPRYDCIAWATQALLESGAATRDDPLVIATLRWIDTPDDDDVRRTAGELANEARKSTPAKFLALAVFYSGGSIAPREMPAVQPSPDLSAKASSGAILMGAYTLPDPAQLMRRALAIGERIVNGAT